MQKQPADNVCQPVFRYGQLATAPPTRANGWAMNAPDGYGEDPARIPAQSLCLRCFKDVELNVGASVLKGQAMLLRHNVVPAFHDTPTSCQ